MDDEVVALPHEPYGRDETGERAERPRDEIQVVEDQRVVVAAGVVDDHVAEEGQLVGETRLVDRGKDIAPGLRERHKRAVGGVPAIEHVEVVAQSEVEDTPEQYIPRATGPDFGHRNDRRVLGVQWAGELGRDKGQVQAADRHVGAIRRGLGRGKPQAAEQRREHAGRQHRTVIQYEAVDHDVAARGVVALDDQRPVIERRPNGRVATQGEEADGVQRPAFEEDRIADRRVEIETSDGFLAQ